MLSQSFSQYIVSNIFLIDSFETNEPRVITELIEKKLQFFHRGACESCVLTDKARKKAYKVRRIQLPTKLYAIDSKDYIISKL